MKFPRLVRVAKTPIRVIISSQELSEYGDFETLFEGDLMCNFQEKHKRENDGKSTETTYSAKVYVDGDINPNNEFVGAGKVIVNGIERKIVNGCKCRNADGSVNYTFFEVE